MCVYNFIVFMYYTKYTLCIQCRKIQPTIKRRRDIQASQKYLISRCAFTASLSICRDISISLKRIILKSPQINHTNECANYIAFTSLVGWCAFLFGSFAGCGVKAINDECITNRHFFSSLTESTRKRNI